MNMNRNPGGTPTGGQFAATDHAEADGVSLTDDISYSEVDRDRRQAEQYLDLLGHADIHEWAHERDYTYDKRNDAWRSEDGYSVDIDEQFREDMDNFGFDQVEDMTEDEIAEELATMERHGSKRHVALRNRQADMALEADQLAAAAQVASYLDKNGYKRVEDWALDAGYTEHPDGWADSDGNPANIDDDIEAEMDTVAATRAAVRAAETEEGVS